MYPEILKWKDRLRFCISVLKTQTGTTIKKKTKIILYDKIIAFSCVSVKSVSCALQYVPYLTISFNSTDDKQHLKNYFSWKIATATYNRFTQSRFVVHSAVSQHTKFNMQRFQHWSKNLKLHAHLILKEKLLRFCIHPPQLTSEQKTNTIWNKTIITAVMAHTRLF